MPFSSAGGAYGMNNSTHILLLKFESVFCLCVMCSLQQTMSSGGISRDAVTDIEGRLAAVHGAKCQQELSSWPLEFLIHVSCASKNRRPFFLIIPSFSLSTSPRTSHSKQLDAAKLTCWQGIPLSSFHQSLVGSGLRMRFQHGYASWFSLQRQF